VRAPNFLETKKSKHPRALTGKIDVEIPGTQNRQQSNITDVPNRTVAGGVSSRLVEPLGRK